MIFNSRDEHSHVVVLDSTFCPNQYSFRVVPVNEKKDLIRIRNVNRNDNFKVEYSKLVIEYPNNTHWTTKALVLAFAMSIETSFSPI
jgi:hypothetical protein